MIIKVDLVCGSLLALMVASAWSQAEGFMVWVPNGLDARTEGNSQSTLPFNFFTNSTSYDGPIHYQQVYAASEFTNAPSGGSFLIGFSIRPDCGNLGGAVTTNLEVRISTSHAGPDSMSSEFRQNAGFDEILTFQATRFAFASAEKSCPEPQSAYTVELDVPFFYDPAKGNLLIDVRYSGFRGLHSPAVADTQDFFGDGVSRVAALSLTSPTADFVDTHGLVTLFAFVSPPSLSVEVQLNALVITWPYAPSQFLLQWNQALDGRHAWLPYTGAITASAPGGVAIKQTKIELDSAFLRFPRFFRLFLNTPQPGIPGGTILALPATSNDQPQPHVTP